MALRTVAGSICRHLPLFHICRPLVELSKKELALFRLFEGLAAVPTQPYLLHEDLLFSPAGAPVRNPYPSVRWLLQEFIIGMEKDNSAVIHNLLSASRKLEPAFTGWSNDETRRPHASTHGTVAVTWSMSFDEAKQPAKPPRYKGPAYNFAHGEWWGSVGCTGSSFIAVFYFTGLWCAVSSACCLCWKAPAANLYQILGGRQLFTPRQRRVRERRLPFPPMSKRNDTSRSLGRLSEDGRHCLCTMCIQIAEEHLLHEAAATRLCFACIRDATSAGSAAQIARILCM